MKIISWNVRRATEKSGAWDYILDADPDIALLQEVSQLHPAVRERYLELSRTAVTEAGQPQRFTTTILTKFPVKEEIDFQGSNEWVQEQADFFAGNLVGVTLQLTDQPLHIVNVYAPAWPIARAKWADVDMTGLKLTANRDVWCTEILWDLLKQTMPALPGQWIVGGDFNSSETFDFGRGGDRGNREVMARLVRLGFTEVLREHHGRLVPTFMTGRTRQIVHQLDHVYVTRPLSEKLVSCDVGDQFHVIGGRLSDHLPICAQFSDSRF